jgi:two-component system cell cycle sensor histidine kinase/response regulator CckA
MGEQARVVVLILEDHPTARLVMRAVLENSGYQVLEATNEREAVALCDNAAQQIDVMVSDVILSNANGPDIAQRIMTVRPALPILFVSGYGAEDLVSLGLFKSNTRVAFLQKPFLPQVFLKYVEKLTARA